MTLEFLIFPNEIACRIVMTLLHDSVMTIFWARETLLLKHGYESLLMNLISQKILLHRIRKMSICAKSARSHSKMT